MKPKCRVCYRPIKDLRLSCPKCQHVIGTLPKAKKQTVCGSCLSCKPPGKWPAGVMIWIWRMTISCRLYKIKGKPRYHQNAKDPRPLRWVVMHPGDFSPTWLIRETPNTLDWMVKHGYLKPTGTRTGYWHSPDGYGYWASDELFNKLKELKAKQFGRLRAKA